MRSYIMPFGKYKGQCLFWIYQNDIDYLIWAYNEITTLPEHAINEMKYLIAEYVEFSEKKSVSPFPNTDLLNKINHN